MTAKRLHVILVSAMFFAFAFTGWALAHNTHINQGYYHGLGDATDFDNHFHPFNEHQHTDPHNNYIGWGYIQVGRQFDKWANTNHNHYDVTGTIYSELYAFSVHESNGTFTHSLARHKHCHHNNNDTFCTNSP